MTIRFVRAIQIFALFLTPVGGLSEADSGQKSIYLIPEPDSMVVRARVPYMGDEEFTFLLPKMIGESRMEFVNYPYPEVTWSEPDDDGAVACEWAPGVLLSYKIKLTPYYDYVDIDFQVTNQTDLQWQDVWFFTFLAPMNAPAFQDSTGERTWIYVGEEPLAISECNWVSEPWPSMTFFLLDDVKSEPHFVRNFGQTSETRPNAPWMIGFNETEDHWFGMAMPSAIFLFRNRELSSVHVAPRFGDLGPGETATVRGRAYFAAGDLDTAVSRIKSDSEEMTVQKAEER